jgi:hypothetical protein
MTIGPDPIISIRLISLRFGKYSVPGSQFPILSSKNFLSYTRTVRYHFTPWAFKMLSTCSRRFNNVA